MQSDQLWVQHQEVSGEFSTHLAETLDVDLQLVELLQGCSSETGESLLRVESFVSHDLITIINRQSTISKIRQFLGYGLASHCCFNELHHDDKILLAEARHLVPLPVVEESGVEVSDDSVRTASQSEIAP